MLFYLHEPSWILVIQRNLQTVDALYASLQIRCTAHNLRIAGFPNTRLSNMNDITETWYLIADSIREIGNDPAISYLGT